MKFLGPAQRLIPPLSPRFLYGHQLMSWLPQFPSSSQPVGWEAAKTAQSTGTLDPCGRARAEPTSSWLQIGPALSVVATWGMNPWVEDVSVSPLCRYTSPIKINLFKKLNNKITECLCSFEKTIMKEIVTYSPKQKVQYT